jgi:hypothetical protein
MMAENAQQEISQRTDSIGLRETMLRQRDAGPHQPYPEAAEKLVPAAP